MNNNYDNNTPHCQNTMFSNLFHSPYYYQPLIHVPTRTSALTVGEVAASVDMMRAQMAEFSTRIDAIESMFSEFKSSVSNDIFLLKNTLFEHSTELLNVRECVENTRACVKEAKDAIDHQDVCIDTLTDAVRQNIFFHKKQQQIHSRKSMASNIDLGIIRRRLSKMEDFTNEFYEQFESFKCVKHIITTLSDHVNECDRDISIMIAKDNQKNRFLHSDGDNGDGHSNDISSLRDYFSKYSSDNEDSTDAVRIEDDDFEKL